jgi:Xaa-Pro aminopeptidase
MRYEQHWVHDARGGFSQEKQMDYRDEVYFDSKPENEAPFGREEFRDRLTKVRQRMLAENIELIYLMAPESMYYLSGYQTEWYQAQSPLQWPAASAIAVHVDHDDYILFDSEREAVLGRITTHSSDTRFFPRDSLRGSTHFVVDTLKQKGWLTGTVGMEFSSYRPNRVISQGLQAAFEGAGARVVDCTSILRDVRWIKSPAEIHCLEEAARIANIGLAAAHRSISAGVTELDVYGEIVRAMAAAGGENPGITMPVLSGSKTNAPHAMASRRKMRRGELVVVDVSGVYKRYHINMARTFFLGEPGADIVTLTNTIAESMEIIRNTLRPNLPIRELGKQVMDYFVRTNLWASRGWIGGYEMGIAFPPDWVGNFVYDPLSDINAERVFEPGTAVNYENQFFLPNHIGQFFTIDSFLFRENGVSMLSEKPFNLIVID